MNDELKSETTEASKAAQKYQNMQNPSSLFKADRKQAKLLRYSV